jgi:hypothetical protein
LNIRCLAQSSPAVDTNSGLHLAVDSWPSFNCRCSWRLAEKEVIRPTRSHHWTSFFLPSQGICSPCNPCAKGLNADGHWDDDLDVPMSHHKPAKKWVRTYQWQWIKETYWLYLLVTICFAHMATKYGWFLERKARCAATLSINFSHTVPTFKNTARSS